MFRLSFDLIQPHRFVWFAGLLLVCAASVRGDEPPSLTLDAGGHTGIVTGFWTLGDDQLLTGSFDTTIRLWDMKRGTTLRTIRGQVGQGRRGQVNSIALTPDGDTLLVAGWFADKEQGQHPIRVYNWPQGTLRGLMFGHESPCKSLSISPDGQYLASGDFNGVVRFWRRAATGYQPLQFVQAHTARISGLAFDPTGQNLLVSTGFDGIARFWNYGPAGLKEISAIRPLSMNNIYGTTFRYDGQVLAIAGATQTLQPNAVNGEVRFFDRQGKPLGKPLTMNDTGITSIAFSHDGRKLAIGCGYPGTSTKAAVYSHPDSKLLMEYNGHDNTINGMRFLSDNRTIVSVGSFDNAILRWDSETGKSLPKLGGRSRFTWNAGVSRDGQTLYWGTNVYDAKAVFKLDKANERGPLDFGLNLSPPAGPELTPAAGSDALRGSNLLGTQRLARYQDPNWQYVEIDGVGAKMESRRDRDVIFGATFLPFADGKKLNAKTPVLVAGQESLGLFDGSTGRRIHELLGHVGPVLAVAPSPVGDFAVSTGGDQTLRLWHLPSGQLRLSVFQAGDDWVAWTPKGYYAASPQGDRLIGWQVNRGEGKDPEHFQAAQFSKLLYRPDLIRQVLDPSAAPDPELGVDKIGEIAPPEVEVLEPAPVGGAAVQLKDGAFEVKALAKSLGRFPVTEVRLMLDGRPYEGEAGLKKIASPRLGRVSASWSIDLPPGTHRLAVQAKTKVSTSLSVSVPVTRASSSAKTPQLPMLYVLAIGVSAYPNGLGLNFAASDAVAIEKVFREKGGVLRQVKTQLLTNEQATRENILSGLDAMQKQMTQRDVGVVFFSGHGMKDNRGNFYLCPVDVKSDKLLSSGVPGGQLREFLSGVPGKIVVLLDACHAGAIAEATRKTSGVLTDDLVRELINEDCGVVVMCSSSGREVSLESNQHRQGYFTLALTQGLSGAADGDGDSIVELPELDRYVSSEVRRLTENRQSPVTKTPPNFAAPPLTSLPTKTAAR